MNRRKIENWVLFCLKMLPFLFLIILTVYLINHKDLITPDYNNEVVYELSYFNGGFEYSGNDINNSFYSDEYGSYFESYVNNNIILNGDVTDNSFNFNYFLYCENPLFLYYTEEFINFYFEFYLYTGNSYEILDLDFDVQFDLDFDTHFTVSYDNVPFGEISGYVSVDDIYTSNFNDISLIKDFSYITFSVSIYADSINNYDNIVLNSVNFICSLENFYIDNYFVTYLSYNDVNPLNQFFNSFVNLNETFFRFDVFGFNQFFDFLSTSWFNGGDVPISFEMLFYLLIYEIIIDLLYLMYSFLCFIIKFAQKWLNGIYNKDW